MDDWEIIETIKNKPLQYESSDSSNEEELTNTSFEALERESENIKMCGMHEIHEAAQDSKAMKIKQSHTIFDLAKHFDWRFFIHQFALSQWYIKIEIQL